MVARSQLYAIVSVTVKCCHRQFFLANMNVFESKDVDLADLPSRFPEI